MNRRNFIAHSSAALAAMMIPDAFAASVEKTRPVGANDRINVALIGCRSMGWGNLAEFFNFPEANCMALCDVDQGVLRQRASELEAHNHKRPLLYTDDRKLLESPDIDAVVIGTPDHWHCLMTVDACAAGKDVYVEKPLANSIAECDAMVAATRRYNRIVQVGQQQRSGRMWHEMKRFIDTGALGKIASVNVWANFKYASILQWSPDSNPPEGVDFDMWLGPAPLRSFNQHRFHGIWRMFWDYGGGLVTDWGVHLLDMALWGTGKNSLPNRVVAVGGNFAFPDNHAETFDTLSATWQYDDLLIQWNNVAANESGPYGKSYGIEFRGTNGSLVANRESWEVYPAGSPDKFSEQHLPDNLDRRNHVANFIACIKDHSLPLACPIENGALCAKFAHLANIAARTRQSLSFNDSAHSFGLAEADALVRPAYRAPWKFPEL